MTKEESKKFREDRSDKICKLYEDGMCQKAIAEEIGVSWQTVHKVLEDEGILRTRKEGVPYGQERIDTVIELRNKGYTFNQIHDETGIDLSSVASISRKYGVGGNKRTEKNIELSKKVRAMAENGMSVDEIADEFNRSYSSIRNIGKKYNIHFPHKKPKAYDQLCQFQELTESGVSMKKAAEMAGITFWQGYGYLRRQKTKEV